MPSDGNTGTVETADSSIADCNDAITLSLNENDVLMGRGSPSSEYSGNLRFRQLVLDRRNEYLSCTTRQEKNQIANEIIQEVHNRGGRFLRRITTMEEAERYKVPPKAQAWRIVSFQSNSLFS